MTRILIALLLIGGAHAADRCEPCSPTTSGTGRASALAHPDFVSR